MPAPWAVEGLGAMAIVCSICGQGHNGEHLCLQPNMLPSAVPASHQRVPGVDYVVTLFATLVALRSSSTGVFLDFEGHNQDHTIEVEHSEGTAMASLLGRECRITIEARDA